MSRKLAKRAGHAPVVNPPVGAVEGERSGVETGEASYERPVLKRLGTLRELTGGAPVPGTSDGAFQGNPPTS